MPRTTFYIEITHQDGQKERGFYGAEKALYLDNKEVLPFSESYIEKHNWKEPLEKENVFIMKGKSYSTPEVRAFNWVDDLPDDVGSESFE